jgi:hypothetical protein
MERVVKLALSVVLLVFLGACTGLKANKADSAFYSTAAAAEADVAELTRVLDYAGKTDGAILPEWVREYLSADEGALEKTPQFYGTYCFVARADFDGLTPLTQWSESFDKDMDFPELVMSRVYKTLQKSSAALGSPYAVYGEYSDKLVSTVKNTIFTDVNKNEQVWLLAEYAEPSENAETENLDGQNGDAGQALYSYLVLLTMEKESFTTQMQLILDSVEIEGKAGRQQLAAWNRLKNSFFEIF